MESWEYLPNPWRQALLDFPATLTATLEEIRFRVGRPVYLYGTGWMRPLSHPSLPSPLLMEHLERIVGVLVEHSLYSRVDELRHGYVTISGGHRVGIAGRAVVRDGVIETVRHITAINMRVGRQVLGAGESLFALLGGRGSWLLAAPPRAGKTTLLRDLIRLWSERGNRLVVIDERSEIAGYGGSGFSEFNLGSHTDVLDGWPKPQGIDIAVRTLGPDRVAVDELGGEDDLAAIVHARQSGVEVLATIHAGTWDDLLRRSTFAGAWHQGVFDGVVFLEAHPVPGTVSRIWRHSGAMDLAQPGS